MEIIKVEERNGLHFVEFEHNGITMEYCLEHSFCKEFLDELIAFQKTFFENGEVDWNGVMTKEQVDKELDSYVFLNEVL